MKPAFLCDTFVQFFVFNVIFKLTIALRAISRSPRKFQAAHRAGDSKLPGHPVSRIVTQLFCRPPIPRRRPNQNSPVQHLT
jgi:hypothetical protein